MTPSKYNFEMWIGNDEEVRIGFPFDLTDFTIQFTYKLNNVQTTLAMSKSLVTANPVEWDAFVTVPVSVTRTFKPNIKMPYEIQLTNNVTNTQTTYLSGVITANGGINAD